MLKFFEKVLNKKEKISKEDYWERGEGYILLRQTLIKHLHSKGPNGSLVALTVDDIQKGYVVDFDGYRNEIVLFLRKNKKDR